MTLANGWTGVVLLASFGLWAAFIASYVLYGNRLRAPAGRALMVMSFGYAMILVPQILRHPFGVTTANSVVFAWFQICAIALSAAGTLAILLLMIRANGHAPWKKPGNENDGGAGDDAGPAIPDDRAGAGRSRES